MQPQESPGNMLLFLCHCIVNIRKLNMNVNLNIGLLPIYLIYNIIFPDFQIQVYQLSFPKNNSTGL